MTAKQTWFPWLQQRAVRHSALAKISEFRVAVAASVVFLWLLGALAILASTPFDLQSDGQGTTTLAMKHMFVGLGSIVLGIGFQLVPMRWIERSVLPLFLLVVMALILVLGPLGMTVNHARRWLNLGLLTLQPGELAKIALILLLAKSLARKGSHTTASVAKTTLSVHGPNLFALAALAIPLLLQPDLGTAVLLGGIAFGMMFVAGMNRRIMLSALGVAAAGLVGLVLYAPYRLRRILSFMDPWSARHEGGYQIIQSYLGFQQGGLLGSGLGESRQKLFFLPEAHNDFILSVVGEEMGLLGVGLVSAFFMHLVVLGFAIARSQARDSFQYFTAIGCTLAIGMQAALNMGVVTGVLPTKGIGLPFVSAGATSLLVFMALAALLCRLGRRDRC